MKHVTLDTLVYYNHYFHIFEIVSINGKIYSKHMALFWSLFSELNRLIYLEGGLQATMLKKDDNLDFLQFAVEISYRKKENFVVWKLVVL